MHCIFGACGYGLMAEREISNLSVGVRFPLPAPNIVNGNRTAGLNEVKEAGSRVSQREDL